MTQSAVQEPPGKPVSQRPRGSRRYFVMQADWEFYSRMLNIFEEKAGYRLAYDGGRLEIMSPSMLHDDRSDFIGDLIKILAKEFGLPLKRGRTVTLRRRQKKKGIEADNSYWIANAEKMAGVDKLNLKIHPPPDLCVEVDVSRSSLNRLAIYAALGVPELWRLDGEQLQFYVLNDRSKYSEAAESRWFAGVKSSDLIGYILESRTAGDETPILDRFREWVRQKLGK